MEEEEIDTEREKEEMLYVANLGKENEKLRVEQRNNVVLR